MAKTKKVPEKQPEVMELRRTTRSRTRPSRPSLVLPSLRKSKDTVKSAASSSVSLSTKTKAKNKTKNGPSTPKTSKTSKISKTSKKQPIASSSETASVGGTRNKSSNNRSSHGDLHTKPVKVNLQRLFSETGELPNNLLTTIIQKDWQKHMTDTAQAKSNTSLKGIEYFPYQAMHWRHKKGVTYAMYDIKKEDNLRVGVLIIEPGSKKKSSTTGQYIKYTVLCGKVKIIADTIREPFDSGSIFTVPPKAKYTIKNVSKYPCYLNFFSYGGRVKQ